MKNKGKQFEADFKASAEKVISYDRLNDPGSSFNIHCSNCEHKVTRFAPQNLCDAIGYSYPNLFYFELKTVKGKSVPFKNIVKSEKDKRLIKLAAKNKIHGAYSCIILNFRGGDNHTYAVNAENVLNYIETASRKSIPLSFCEEYGIRIKSSIKRVHYSYDIRKFLFDLTGYLV